MKNNQGILLLMVASLLGLAGCGISQDVTKEPTLEVEEEVEVPTDTLEEIADTNSDVANEEVEDIEGNDEDLEEDMPLELEDGTITVEDLSLIEELIDEDASFFLVISAKTCGYCALYEEETLNHYSKEEVGVHLLKLEWTALTDDEKEEVREITELGIEVTPTTFLFKDGDVVLKKEDSLTINQLKEMVD